MWRPTRPLWIALALGASALPARAEQAPPLSRSAHVLVVADSAKPAHKQIEDAARSLGGTLVQSSAHRIVVAVPFDQYDALITKLAGAGQVTRARVQTRDLTTALGNARGDVQAAETRVSRMERLERLSVGVQDGLALSRAQQSAADELASAKSRVAELEQRARRIEVTIDLRAPTPDHVEGATLPFPWLNRLGEAHLANPETTRHFVLRNFFEAALEGTFSYVADGPDGDDVLAGSGGAKIRGLGEAVPIGLFGGFDSRLGAGSGFVYQAQVLGGVGLALGKRTVLGVSTGPGIDGITSVVPFGVRLPIELYASVDVSDDWLLAAWVQDGWVFASEERQDGAPHAPFGDELAAGLYVSFGDASGDYSSERAGPSLGFAYREVDDLVFYEATVAFRFRFTDFSEE